MIKGDFDLNTRNAFLGEGPEYELAYPITNEPLNIELGLTDNENAHILTVAGSGDQPLMYTTAGAAHIDTFDLTYHARVLMDFKTTAVKIMNFAEYNRQISVIHNMSQAQTEPKFWDCVRHMPHDTGDIMSILGAHCKSMFWRGLMPYSPCIRDEEQYREIQRNAPHQFNFIWTDLVRLHNHLETDYDVINISNIFDHYQMFSNRPLDRYPVQTVKNLWPFLRVGGSILFISYYGYSEVIAKNISKVFGNAVQIKIIDCSPERYCIAIAQRVR